MHQPPDILTLAYKQPFMQEQLLLLDEKERQIPGSVQYMIRRYEKNPLWNLEDTGMMVYHFQRKMCGKIISNCVFVFPEMSIAGRKRKTVPPVSCIISGPARIVQKPWM